MDNVSLNRSPADKKAGGNDDLDNLIFKDNKAQPKVDAQEASGSSERQSQNSETELSKENSNRSSISNVLPMDKIKNGASTATKLFGSALAKAKEKSSGLYETAKTSQAGSAISSGLNKAVSATSEQLSKVKETDTYKKSSKFAGDQWNNASSVAAVGLEKAKAGASVGVEMAKTGAASAASGIETVKNKISEKKGGGGGAAGGSGL